MSKYCLGIDFGTTNSCLSIWDNNKAYIISDYDGSDIIPSVIEISDNKKIVGKQAYIRKDIFDITNNNENQKPTFIIYEIKKLIGQKYSELNNKTINLLGYEILSDHNDNIKILNKSNNKTYYVEEIAINIFMSFKNISEIYLSKLFNKNIILEDAVISVPAYFNKIQREIIKNCASNAGFNILRLINEPTAAALSYGLGKNFNKSLNILVYDFGGGTLDISLLNISDGVYEVLGSCGNNNLGGSDFDLKIMEYCITKFIENNNINSDNFIENINENILQKLKYLSEQAKIILTDNLNARIKIDQFYNNINLDIKIDREIFNQITQDLLNIILKPIIDVLECTELNKEDINEIILVGGMTKIPIVRYNIERFFNKDVNCSINPDNVVSIGAAIHGYMIINNKNIEDNLLLIDRTSLSIGVETTGNLMDIIIPRGTIMPTKKNKKYTTDTDYVESIDIKIYEGERKFTKDNYLIADFTLSGIEKKKRGIPEIQITFEIDLDGLIKIKAEDLDNPLNKKSIQVSSNKQNLTSDQINEIINNAKIMDKNDKIDKMKKESYLSLVDSSQKIIENINSDDFKIDNVIKQAINDNVTEILEWLKLMSYDDIEVDKYKELLHDYKINYSIYLLKNNSPIQELSSADDDDTKVVSIYNDDLDSKKYIEEIKYVRNIIDEYDDIKKKLDMIKNIDNPNIQNKDDLKILLQELNNLFENVYNNANDIIIKLFVDDKINDNDVQELCSKLYEYDINFKNEFEKFNNEFDSVNKLFNIIKEKENKLLELLEKTTNDNEIEIINNKLDIIIEFESYIYKINNNYMSVDNDKILEITKILDGWNI